MTTGVLLFYGLVALWSAVVAYTLLFSFAKRSTPAPIKTPMEPVAPPPSFKAAIEPPPVARQLSEQGFKAFQSGEELTVDDIVKALSRKG